MPSEMGVESGEGRWCDGVDEGVVVVGRCVCKREAGEGVLWIRRIIVRTNILIDLYTKLVFYVILTNL